MPEITSEELARLRAIEEIAMRMAGDPLWGIRIPDAEVADQLLDLLLPGEVARRRQNFADALNVMSVAATAIRAAAIRLEADRTEQRS